MHLSLFSDYSLRVLMYAALKGDTFQLSDVSTAYAISRNHVAKVIPSLSKLGYLDTKRGRGGGIQLACPAEDIRIGKLIRETEDQPVIVECFDHRTNTCPINGSCRLKSALAAAMSAFYESLDRFTLQDLVTGPQRKKMSSLLLAGSDQTR